MAAGPRLALSPEAHAALYHATTFVAGGVLVAYFTVWMGDLGLTAAQIGIVNALPLLLMLLTSQLVGRIADRASDWRVVIIALSLFSALTAFGFGIAQGFWGALIVFALFHTPSSAMMPVLDAATMRLAQRRGSSFASIRAWGTVGFVLAAALSGLAIGVWGGAAFVPMMIGAALLRAAFSLQLPRFRAPGQTEAPPARGGIRFLMRPWFILPCIAFALINATHFFLGYMGGVVWALDGISPEWFGPLAAYSAMGEAAMMFLWARLNWKLSARSLLIISGLTDVVRYIAMSMHPSLPALFALQTLHAVAYPFSYFGLVQFIADWAPEENAAEAQGFASMLTQGFAVLTFLSFGGLIAAFGTQVFLVASAMCLVGAAAAWLSLRLKPQHRAAG